MNLDKFVKGAGVAAALAAGYSYFSEKADDLSNRVVLITGAAAGVGRLCAIAFANEGCKVCLWDISEEGLALTKAAILDAVPGCSVWIQCVDVADRDAVYKAAEITKSFVAPFHVSILVNNAGIMSGGKSFLETPDENILSVFRVNTLAHMWLCKALIPQMLEARMGHIVTVASAAGLIAAPGMVDYSASKFAAVGFTEGMRKELRAMHGDIVRTSLICPAAISTALFKGFDQPLFPALDPQYVANQIVDAVRYRREMLVEPRGADPSMLKAIFPVSAADAICRWIGHDKMMKSVDKSHAEKTLKMLHQSKL